MEFVYYYIVGAAAHSTNNVIDDHINKHRSRHVMTRLWLTSCASRRGRYVTRITISGVVNVLNV